MSPIAEVIAGIPGLAARLMAEHHDDGSGHCRRCTIGALAGWLVWPCNIYSAAETAVRRPDADAPPVP